MFACMNYFCILYHFQVRDFHKKFYRAENLTIILTGQIAAEDVFKVLSIVEDDIMAKVVSYLTPYVLIIYLNIILKYYITSIHYYHKYSSDLMIVQ